MSLYKLSRRIEDRLWFHYAVIRGIRVLNREDLYRRYSIFDTSVPEQIEIGDAARAEDYPKVFAPLGTYTVLRSFVAEVAEAKLCGSYGITLDNKGNILLENCLLKPGNLIKSGPLKSILTFKSNKKEPLACSLLSIWSNNYFHWTADTLTRLQGLESYHEKTGVRPKLIVAGSLTRWQIESLNMLGYQMNDCVTYSDSLQVEKLIIPTFGRENPASNLPRLFIAKPSAFVWLRKRMIAKAATGNCSEPTRIYVSRGKTLSGTNRATNIVNEDALLVFLQSFGFTVIYPEDFSVSEQVGLFSRAEFVVGQHGANMTNIIYCPEKTRVLEIFNHSLINSVFYVFSNVLKLRYGFIMGDDCKGGIEVDLRKFGRVLNDLMSVSEN